MLSRSDHAIICALQDGLPLVERPFRAAADELGRDESAVIEAVQQLLGSAVIKRFGIVVRHRSLGYLHNAMVVWDVADAIVDEVGARASEFGFVTLCYRRPRRLPLWPYNLFAMVHGRDRGIVMSQIEQLEQLPGLVDAPHEVLFSRRCFKQRGARYTARAR